MTRFGVLAVAVAVCSVLCAIGASADEATATGTWSGQLTTRGGDKVPIVVHIGGADPNLTGTFDSPAQGVTGVPMSTLTIKGAQVQFAIDNAQIRNVSYSGSLNGDTIAGTLSDGTTSFPLTLTRSAAPVGLASAPAASSGVGAAGDYSGELNTGSQSIPVAIHVYGPDSSLTGTYDSPAYHVTQAPLSSVTLRGSTFTFEARTTGISFVGELKSGTITGTLSEGGTNLALTLKRL